MATIRLDFVAQHYQLDEFTVTARPKLIRLERGRLQVDLCPVYQSGDAVKLSGANAFSFLLNGKTNGMPQEQIISLVPWCRC